MIEYYRDKLLALERDGLLRTLKPVDGSQGPTIRLEGRELLCLSANNYLGLAGDPRLADAAKAAIDAHGWGSGASRLISGDHELLHRLEKRLAKQFQAPAALLFGNGTGANIGCIDALCYEQTLIFSDELNHASLIDGCRLSRAHVTVYRHNDMDDLDALLHAAPPDARKWIVTDAVFSMDGDVAPLHRLVAIKERHGAMLYLDEAHAVGIYGEGAGLAVSRGLADRVEIRMGTLGKALGGYGAFVLADRLLIDFLLNRARTQIFATAQPPAQAAAALAALDIVRDEPERREQLMAHAHRMRSGLREQGWRIVEGDSPIIAVIVGETAPTMQLAAALRDRGIWVPGIRPPTVPRATGRLRVSVMATHTPEQLDRALEAFADAGRELGLIG